MALYDNDGVARYPIERIYDNTDGVSFSVGRLQDTDGVCIYPVWPVGKDLYLAGDELTATTGGWTASAAAGGCSVVKRSECLHATGTNLGADTIFATAYTGKTIAVDGYTWLMVAYTDVAGNAGVRLALSSTADTGGIVKSGGGKNRGDGARRVFGLNIAQLSGSFYVLAGVLFMAGETGMIDIHNIWLE